MLLGGNPDRSSPAYEQISKLIPWPQHIPMDAFSILKTFVLLTVLFSRDIHVAQRKDVRSVIVKLWDRCNPDLHPQPLPMDRYFKNIIYLGIEGGSRVPFLRLYSSSTQELFDHSGVYFNSNPQEGNSMQCMQFPSSPNRHDS